MIRLRSVLKICIVYLIFFIGSIIVFSFLLNQGKMSGSLQDSGATLPVVYVRAGGQNINEMHGYTDNIDAGYFRDTMTPVTDSSTVNLVVDEHDHTIQSAFYELYNDQYDQQIESGDCTDFEKKDSVYQMKVVFGSTLYSNREYILRIILVDSDQQEINYYTRIRYGSDLKIAEKLDFIMDFNEATFDKNQENSISAYLESSSSSSSDLSDVSLYSSSDAVTWGSLAPYRTSDLNIDLKEINTETAAFTMTYTVESDENDETSFYDVSEYYRLRWTDEKVYLLDFEREMQEDISESDVTLENGAICLGIQENDDIVYAGFGTEDQSYGYFAVGNQLWHFDSTNNIMTSVYNGSNDQDSCSGHTELGIKVIKADNDTGDLYFAVYGYMHQGDYEGKMGIMLYHFSYEDVCLEEIMFIPYDKGFAQLQAGIDNLAYMNDSEIYLMVDDTVYRISPGLGRLETAWTGLDSNNCAVSDDGRLVVTENSDGTGRCGDNLRIIDLNTDEESTFDVSGMKITPLGFMGSDLIYGLVDGSLIAEDSSGILQTPISKVVIAGSDLKDIKTYEKSGSYIRDITIKEENIELELEKPVANGSYTDYESNGTDYIVRNEADQTAVLTLTSQKDSYRGYEKWLQFDSTNTLYPISQTARNIDPGYDVTKELELSENVEVVYYVYTKGRLYEEFPSLKEAVTFGSTGNSGATIMSSHKQIIWQKAGRAYVWELNVESIDQGATSKAQAQSMIKAIAGFEGWEIASDIDYSQPMYSVLSDASPVDTIDLTGIALTDVLHFVYRDRIVIARTSSGGYSLIVGYDENNKYIELADPSTGEISWESWTNAEALFEENGNVFYSYLD